MNPVQSVACVYRRIVPRAGRMIGDDSRPQSAIGLLGWLDARCLRQTMIGFMLVVSACSSLGALPVPSTPARGAVSAGVGHVLFLRNDGTVWAAGENYYGQLGNQSTYLWLTPVRAGTLSGIVDIASGSVHSVALKRDGTVWVWGANYHTQLGEPYWSVSNQLTPMRMAMIDSVVAVAAGSYHTAMLRMDGTVWTCGSNSQGQLGHSTESTGAPKKVDGLNGVVAVKAGDEHMVALREDGTVWAWGSNSDGQLGGAVNRKVPGLVGVIAVAAGGAHSLALQNDGTVWAWGRNSEGQLGDGTQTSRSTPVQVPGLSGVVALAAGDRFSVALDADGSVWAWGDNSGGQLGVPLATKLRLLPEKIPGLANVCAISAYWARTFAIRSDGMVWSVGQQSVGCAGDGSYVSTISPVQVSRRTNAQAVACGIRHSLALERDGSVWSWGENGSGQLGDGSTATRETEVRVGIPVGCIAIAVGSDHSVAVATDGTVWTWGNNQKSQLGNGSITTSTRPINLPGLDGVVAVAAGREHTMALRADGTVWAWGGNGTGQLGFSAPTPSSIPKQIPGLSDVVAIAAVDYHSLCLKSDGTVFAWGNNNSGQLGNGLRYGSTIPEMVPGLVDVVAIATGPENSLFLKADGTVMGCGRNLHGELGDGTSTERLTVVPLDGVSNVVAVGVGAEHAVALRSDGTVLGWGSNRYGQFGYPFSEFPYRPRLVSLSGRVVAISVGSTNTLAVREDRTISGWGRSYHGQLAFASGRLSASAIRLVTSTEDTDQDGMDDQAEFSSFGSLAHDGGRDSDLDGLTDIQELVRNTNPTIADADGDRLTDFVDEFPKDYFNGETPLLTVVGGDKRYGVANSFNDEPFEIAVWDAAGTTPLVNAPVSFTVVSGSGQMALTNDGTGALSYTIEGRTDEDGTVRAYYRQPASTGLKSAVLVQAAAAHLTVQTTSVGQPEADDDADGVTNGTEIVQGTDPGDFYNGAFPRLSFIVGADGELGSQGLVTLQVQRASDGQPLANAPVVFRFSSGASLIAATPGGPALRNLTVRTDADGIARGYVTLNCPATQVLNAIVYCGGVSSGVPVVLRKPSLDSDGDGVTDTVEVANGTDPTDYYNGVQPVVTPLFDQASRSPYRFVSVQLRRAADGAPLANAPVRLMMTTGACSILNMQNGQLGSGFDARTDASGIVRGMVVFTSPGSPTPDYLLVRVVAARQPQVTPFFLPAPL